MPCKIPLVTRERTYVKIAPRQSKFNQSIRCAMYYAGRHFPARIFGSFYLLAQ